MDIIKELNNFDNLLKIEDENMIKNKDKKEINEISKINEEKNINIKEYKRNEKLIKEISNKSLNINRMNKEMYQNIQQLYLNTLNYILPESDLPLYDNGIINSKIINSEQDFNLINEYLSSLYKKKIRYKLIFRASEDGAYGKYLKKNVQKFKEH